MFIKKSWGLEAHGIQETRIFQKISDDSTNYDYIT